MPSSPLALFHLPSSPSPAPPPPPHRRPAPRPRRETAYWHLTDHHHMPFLGIFGRKDAARSPKLKSPHSRSSFSRSELGEVSPVSTNDDDDDYVIPPIPSLATGFYSTRESSSRNSQSRRSLPPPVKSTLRLVTSPSSSLPPELQLPTIKHSPLDELRRSTLFASIDPLPSSSVASFSSQPNSSRTVISTSPQRSNPPPRAATLPPAPSQNTGKRTSLFGWISGNTKKKSSSDVRSTTSWKSLQEDSGSFRLSSFRRINSSAEEVPPVPPIPSSHPVLTLVQSTPVSSTSKSNTGFQVTSRPRVTSKEATSSPVPSAMVTAGAFRQAARRSATNLPLPATTSISSVSSPIGGHDIPSSRSPDRTATPPSAFRETRTLRQGIENTPTHPARPPREIPSPRLSADSISTRHRRQPASGNSLNPQPQRRPIPPQASSSESSEGERHDGRQSTATIVRRSEVRQSQSTTFARTEIGHGARDPQRPRSYARTDSGHNTIRESSTSQVGDVAPFYNRPRASQSASVLSDFAKHPQSSSKQHP